MNEEIIYQELPGAYEIKNTLVGIRYIGTSTNVKRELQENRRRLRKNIHCNQDLQTSWNRDGEDNFKFMVICYCGEDSIKETRQKVLLSLPKDEILYNMRSLIGNDQGRHKSKYEENRKAGLCVKCGAVVGSEAAYCQECSTLDKQRYYRYKKAGVCVQCGQNKATQRIYCQECNDKRISRKHEKRKNHICLSCNNPAIPDHSYCKDCLDKGKRLRQIRMDNGLCRDCGRPALPNKKICQYHLDQYEKRRADRKANGKCTKCGDEGVLGKTTCSECSLKRHARSANTTVSILKEIWNEQKGRCAYSGRELELGRNASVDHRMPRSLGGSDEKCNLQWVDHNVNIAKLNLTEDQFKQMIIDCSSHLALHDK